MAKYRTGKLREFLPVAKALADPNRARILMFLRGGELCVCQIIEMLHLAPSTVSKHVAVLHQAGLVESRKQGRWIYYRLARGKASASARQAVRWVQRSLADDEQVAKDAKRLKAVRKVDKEELCARYKRS